MALRFRCWPPSHAAVVLIAAFALVVACAPRDKPPASTDESPGPAHLTDLTDFATRYAAAWSSQDPGHFASFYEEDGILVVNGSASEGRGAIRTTAGEFMAAFPDMRQMAAELP